MESLFQLLNHIRPLSDELTRHLLSILKHEHLKKGDFLLRDGQLCGRICFISYGLLHSYVIKHRSKSTVWLMPENNVIVAVESFFNQVAGDEYVEALEDTEVYYLTYDELEQTCLQFLEFNVHYRKLQTNYYVLASMLLKNFQNEYGPERFKWFLQVYPGLTDRVAARHIATFLGLSEETLSRIKSQHGLD